MFLGQEMAHGRRCQAATARRLRRWLLRSGCFLLPLRLIAASVALLPVADTMLIQLAPTNSAGGADFFNAGTTQNRTRNRALLRFDLASAIPSNAVITSAALTVWVTAQSLEAPEPSVFGLHRLLRPWGEGATLPDYSLGNGGGGWGGRAATNDATWTHRFAFTDQTWAAPGGAPNVDYVSTFSSSILIEGPASYLFESTVDLTADAQLWLRRPETNFGWMMMTEAEDTPFTARRFASRENAGLEPVLTIEFLRPPVLTNVSATSDQIQFTFTAEAGQTYLVQRAAHLPASDWTNLLTFGPPVQSTNVSVADPSVSGRRFYRVRTF